MDGENKGRNEEENYQKEFGITENGLISEIKKRKKWIAPGVGEIQNLWQKRFRLAQKALKKAFEQIRDDNRLISTWWLLGGDS